MQKHDPQAAGAEAHYAPALIARAGIDILASLCAANLPANPPGAYTAPANLPQEQPSAPLVQRYMRVEMALNIIQSDAGLSAGLMAQLRETVQSGLQRQTWRQIFTSRAGQGVAATPATAGALPYVDPPAVCMEHACTSSESSPEPPSRAYVAPPQAVTPRHPEVHLVRKVKPPSSKKQQLTAQEAAHIYTLRNCWRNTTSEPHTLLSSELAIAYGVTPKTIQDVWSGRTWKDATKHLWTSEEIAQRVLPVKRRAESLPSCSEGSGAKRAMTSAHNESAAVANLLS